MQPNFEAWDFVLALANAAGVMVVGVYTWWTNRDKATADAIEGLRNAMDNQTEEIRLELTAIERRVNKSEHEIGTRLKLQDLGDLYELMNRMNREMGELNAELKANRAQLQLHQEYLMSKQNPFGL